MVGTRRSVHGDWTPTDVCRWLVSMKLDYAERQSVNLSMIIDQAERALENEPTSDSN